MSTASELEPPLELELEDFFRWRLRFRWGLGFLFSIIIWHIIKGTKLDGSPPAAIWAWSRLWKSSSSELSALREVL
jgi:hypothetical protein